jgi:hypothetical protein
MWTVASLITMKFAAAQQSLRDVSGLKYRAIGRRMGRKVARYGNQIATSKLVSTPY